MATRNAAAQRTDSEAFAGLRRYQFAELTTFRKDGRAVATPVWFAPNQDKLYVMTPSTTGKLKRIRTNGHVLLAPCNQRGRVLGTAIALQARVLAVGSSDSALADAALARKYGFLYRVITFFQKLRKVERTFIEIS